MRGLAHTLLGCSKKVLFFVSGAGKKKQNIERLRRAERKREKEKLRSVGDRGPAAEEKRIKAIFAHQEGKGGWNGTCFAVRRLLGGLRAESGRPRSEKNGISSDKRLEAVPRLDYRSKKTRLRDIGCNRPQKKNKEKEPIPPTHCGNRKVPSAASVQRKAPS